MRSLIALLTLLLMTGLSVAAELAESGITDTGFCTKEEVIFPWVGSDMPPHGTRSKLQYLGRTFQPDMFWTLRFMARNRTEMEVTAFTIQNGEVYQSDYAEWSGFEGRHRPYLFRVIRMSETGAVTVERFSAACLMGSE